MDGIMKKLLQNRLFQKSIVILFWLCVWQLLAVWTHNPILLVGPLQVVRAMIENVMRTDFIYIVLYSLCRIGCGFFLALFTGVLLGAGAHRYALLESLLSPVMRVLTSVPVASFTVLLLIWSGSAGLSFFVSFFIVLPNVYVNTTAGLGSVDKKLLEMADVFQMRGWNRFLCLYVPALYPYLISCMRVSLGMSWKSGVAAEVIGMPRYSLGERLYMSKIYLDTAGLFAWTFFIVLLSFCFEKAVLYLFRKLGGWKPYPAFNPLPGRMAGHPAEEPDETVRIQSVSKSYNKQRVLYNFSLVLEKGGRYCLMAPSGSGKTTLLRLLSRMEMTDAGEIQGMPERIGMVFQEDCLCEEYDVISNIIATACPGKAENGRCRKKAQEIAYIREEALKILPEDCLDKPVRELSGGMRRRCAVLRAMLSDAAFFMMDEPFTGLDETSRRETAAYILEKLEGRTLLVTTHREADVELLGGVRVDLELP